MILSSVSDEVIHSKALAAAHDERLATFALLEFLAEIDRRRLYNARGFSSLWEYVHKELGYSESQAFERVAAMRLMRRVPEVRNKVAENKLTLTATAKLAAFVRRENCSVEEVVALADKVAEKSTREVERILAAAQVVPDRRPDRIKSSGPELVRVSFDADPELIALLEQLRDRQGRPEWGLNTRLKVVLRAALRAPEVKGAGAKENPSSSAQPNSSPAGSPQIKSPEKISRYISVKNKQAVRERSGGRCEFVDHVSGRRCESRFDLEFDHIRPFSHGGPSVAENLRHLCSSHNHWEAIKIFGAQKIQTEIAKRT